MSLKSDGLDIYPFYADPEDFLFQLRDDKLNTSIELALLHGAGLYTGIVSVTLWNICGWNIFAVFSIYPRELSHTDISKSRSTGRAMAAVIILLYVTTTINSSLTWALIRSVLAETPYNIFVSGRPWISNIGVGTAAAMSTVIADSIMIWRCWMVWGRRWLIVLFPILCLISGFVFKILEIIAGVILEFESVDLLVIYISCILATTVWCTVLIVFRIVTVIRANNGANSTGLGDYRHVIEVLVESSALHSVTLIVYAALEARGNLSRDYFDTLAVITTGIAPTLLAGRVAAGHARPDNTWEGSIVSSLRFEAHPQADAETCSQIDSMVDDDLEAQSIQVDEPEEIGAAERI